MRDCCKDDLRDLLEDFKDECEEVTIFIQTGSECCARTGCICDVDDCFVTLFDTDDACQRTFILLDTICAVKNCVDQRNRC
ncbi:hypothetical protein [Halanaerobaculum tunisiense]